MKQSVVLFNPVQAHQALMSLWPLNKWAVCGWTNDHQYRAYIEVKT